MGETTKNLTSYEQRVFGEAFSFSQGPANELIQQQFLKERTELIIEAGNLGWIPHSLDMYSENGITADLYKNGRIIARLEFNYMTRLADVYALGVGNRFNDEPLCSEVAFEDAVINAEQFATALDNHPQLFEL